MMLRNQWESTFHFDVAPEQPPGSQMHTLPMVPEVLPDACRKEVPAWFFDAFLMLRILHKQPQACSLP